MKLLFHANRFPYPPFRGDKLKIYNIAKKLAHKHELHLLTFLEDEADLQYIDELKEIFTAIYLVRLPKYKVYKNAISGIFSTMPIQVAYFKSSEMQQKVNELVATQNYDAVHIQHIRLAQFWENHTNVPRILDLPDAFSLYWKRRIDNSKGFSKLFAKLEYKRLFAYESILNKFPKVLVCSQEDMQYLKTAKGINNIDLLHNGVDTELFANNPEVYKNDNVILFTGNMDYAPNVDGVCYFAEQIYPLIKAKMPHVKFIIAGQRPVAKVKALANDDISVTGFIPVLADMYKEATIVVSPLRFGAGTQNKVLEAMSMGIAVVSMKVGFDGLNIQQGEGVYKEMLPQDFANRCIELLQNPQIRIDCGKKGQVVINKNYAWSTIVNKLDAYFNEIIHN
jgi:sugar transferase (PEP-CTERM/EpsH1 system associated)